MGSEVVGIVVGAAAAIFLLYILVLWFVVIPVLVVEDISLLFQFRARCRTFPWPAVGHARPVAALRHPHHRIWVALLLVVATFAADAPILALIVMVPFSALYSVVGAILPVVVYYLLRAEKEGIGIDEIAKVFD